MGDILRTQDGSADVPCNVSFVRDGAVGTFAVGSGSINSSGDYSAVNALPGNVKVVHRINWCGGLIPNILGCAPVPGDSFVVVPFSADQESVLWVHEFGHTRGLSHRAGANLVMNGAIGPMNRRVNEQECSAYR